MAGKTYPSVTKVSLEGVSEGWDASCYAYVTPGTFSDRIRAMELEDTGRTDAERVEFQQALVTEHFVSGRIKSFDGQGFTEAALTVETVHLLPDVSNKLALVVLGYDLDPKGLSELAMDQSRTPTTSLTGTPPTETSSSETSAKESHDEPQTNSLPSDTKNA